MTLTAQRLRELLHYDPETGVFTRRVATSRSHVGSVAGTLNVCGYLVARLDGTLYLLHRLAHLYMTGEWPEYGVDHKDTHRANNCWLNLRPADQRLNMQNQRRSQAGSKSGLLGVSPAKPADSGEVKFRARIVTDGRERHLGTFQTAQLAHEAYIAAKRQHHEGCTI